MNDSSTVEGPSGRRRFVRKLVSVAAVGGVVGLLLGEHAPTVEASTAPKGITPGVNGGFIGVDNNNTVTDDYGVVTGGRFNQAGDNAGTTSDVTYATVGGGDSNTASGVDATVGGGGGNTASGNGAAVGGGENNTASENVATVGGGDDNHATAGGSTVGGGDSNTASGNGAAVGGGENNTASGPGAFVGGGGYDGTTISGNSAGGNASTVAGGLGNTASESYATVGGGDWNTGSGSKATVGGGDTNTASGIEATVGGGAYNKASNDSTTVGGGHGNTASGNVANVGGGYGNTASGVNATVGGGSYNTASGSGAKVGGGVYNTASGANATVPGGYSNVAAASYSFAAGLRAKVNEAHDGALLFADSNDFDFNSADGNEFAVRSTGGVRFVTGIDGSGNPLASRTFVMTNAGNLGIGTASPNQALDVTGNGRFSTGLISPVLKPNSDSTTALQLQTATGTNILNVDTTNSRIGIGTTSPKAQLHVSGSATADVFCGLGPHPEYGSGPAMNYGYSGKSLGEGSGFFNVRPDASAVAPNPSLRFMTVDIQRMIITNKGNVGIGTSSPAYKLDVAGSVHATSFPTSSDMRFKQDITPIDNALDKVLQLQGVYFKWNQLHRETLKRSSTLTSRQVGLIAQQVKEVLPEVVSEWADQGAEDYLAVDYSRLVAITIEAVKELATRNSEQQTQVSEQQSRMQLLQEENEKLQERIAILERTVKQFAAS